jgi:hypothetical protein
METRSQLHREYGEDECGNGPGQCPPKRGDGGSAAPSGATARLSPQERERMKAMLPPGALEQMRGMMPGAGGASDDELLEQMAAMMGGMQ